MQFTVLTAFLCFVMTAFMPARAQVSLTLFEAQARGICDREAVRAARAHGVPVDIMRTITRVETGHTRDGEFRPWPWTVNHDGDGSWHDTRREASQFLRALRQSGYRNFDIGCFQLNFRWHGEHFDSTGDMLDPRKNADYAARFLRQLLQEEGNWTAAVAAYHSRTKHFAERYAARFDAIRRDLDADRPAAQTKSDRSPPASNGGVIPLLAVGSAARPLFLIGGTD